MAKNSSSFLYFYIFLVLLLVQVCAYEEEELLALRVSELRSILAKKKIECRGCTEKRDLVDAILSVEEAEINDPKNDPLYHSEQKKFKAAMDETGQTTEDLLKLAKGDFSNLGAMKKMIDSLGGPKKMAQFMETLGVDQVAALLRSSGMGHMVDKVGGPEGLKSLISMIKNMDKLPDF
eukprot:c304_g1_i1.p1 GENE.c304_g1_i1~~c304_g1_i1.p1  ORF type:complete len:178 (+),score=64.64 c304_g1_i1:29-562(+)